MKKILLLILGFIMTLGLAGCSKNLNREIKNDLLIDVSDYELISSYDDHGGFHNDGKSIYVLRLKNDLSSNLSKNSNWANISGMPKEIHDIIYNHTVFKIDGIVIPEITGGFYIFNNRFIKNIANSYDKEDLPNNFSIGLYDTTSLILYYLVFDS